MIEQVVSFKTAELANEKKFGWQVRAIYTIDDQELIDITHLWEANKSSWAIGAPTQSLLQKWLREIYKINVLVTFSNFSRTYGYDLYYLEDGKTKRLNNRFEKNNTYEEALEEGLQEALRLITL